MHQSGGLISSALKPAIHMTQSDGIRGATRQLHDVRGRDHGKRETRQCCAQQALRRHQAFTSHMIFLSFVTTYQIWDSRSPNGRQNTSLLVEFPSSLKAKQNPTNKLRYAEVQPTSPQMSVLPSSKHGWSFRKQTTGFFTSCSVGLSLKLCLVFKSVSVSVCPFM